MTPSYYSLAGGVTLENNKTISLLSSYPTPGREQTVAGYKTMSALHLGSNNSNVSYLVSRAWRESQPSVLRIWWLVSSSAPGLLNKLTIFRSPLKHIGPEYSMAGSLASLPACLALSYWSTIWLFQNLFFIALIIFTGTLKANCRSLELVDYCRINLEHHWI